MGKGSKELSELDKEITRFATNFLNNGVVRGAEDIVKGLQNAGPSWTGRYSNSWQIEIAGVKRKGIQREGMPKPIEFPNFTKKDVRALMSGKDTIEYEIRNLSRRAEYAEDKKAGRFRTGKFKKPQQKTVTDIPKTAKGRAAIKQFTNPTQGRLQEDLRGSLGGRPGGYSRATAPLDWLPTYLNGGKLKQTIDLSIKQSTRKSKGKHLK
tara:strand:+ start:742 stop:1368 length:627 start_codon:yes stop_codon:yes gene_type:complete